MAEGAMTQYRDTGNTEGVYEAAMEAYKTRLALAQYLGIIKKYSDNYSK